MSTDMADPDELDELHRDILGVLREGRATPSYLAERTGESRQLVSQRLRDLVMADYVDRVHTGLYELVEDPEA
jgi:DNA-binding IclR family transcriptional regulator